MIFIVDERHAGMMMSVLAMYGVIWMTKDKFELSTHKAYEFQYSRLLEGAIGSTIVEILFICTGNRPSISAAMSYVTDISMSMWQCFLHPAGIFHLYYDLVRTNTNIIWNRNDMKPMDFNRYNLKLGSIDIPRNGSLLIQDIDTIEPEDLIRRTMYDHGARRIWAPPLSYIKDGTEHNLFRYLHVHQLIDDFSWYEYNGRTSPYAGPIENFLAYSIRQHTISNRYEEVLGWLNIDTDESERYLLYVMESVGDDVAIPFHWRIH